MGWAAGAFSRVRNWVTDEAGAINIEADLHDEEDDNLAAGINNCLAKDGQNQATADINLGINKLINVKAGTTATDAATIGGTETLQNKTLGDTNTINAQDDAFEVQKSDDATSRLLFDVNNAGGTLLTLASAITVSRTLNFPDADDTLVGRATTDTFTNKTFDANGTGNSLSNVDVADLADGTDGELITWDTAGVPATVAAGTAGHVLTSNGAGAAPTFQAIAAGTTKSSLITVFAAGTGASGWSATAYSNSGGDAHGLSAEPDHVKLYLECTTGDAGYVVGDKILYPTQDEVGAAGGSHVMMTLIDGTNVTVIHENGTSNTIMRAGNKTTGASAPLLKANWKLMAQAFVF